MKSLKALLCLLLLGMFAVAGCQEQGPAEQAGEKVNEEVKEAGRAAEDATN